MRRGAETGEVVVLFEHERLETGGHGGGGPRAGIAFCIRKHERSRAGQFGGSPLDWNTGATARLAPRPRGGARRGEGQLHIRVPPKWVRSTGTPPRRKAPRGPWAESDGGSRPTVRCTSTEPADTDSPITAHATLRTRDNNPDERTTATRASGNTRARSCPHRWTRKDLEGTSNTPLGDAKDLEGTSNKPRGTRGISKGHATSRGGRGGSRRDRPRGEQQGQSFGGPSASARKTEARPRQRAHRAGAWGWRGEPAPWHERGN